MPIRPAPLALLVALVTPLSALAGGMFLPVSGARPLGRAGAYVAGADDLQALVYNPAGLAGTGNGSLLLDAGLILQRVNYERVDAGGNRRQAIDSNNPLIPVPFIAGAWRPSRGLDRRVTFALGAFAPYSAVSRYDPKGPQRYSLISIEGTAALVAELAASVRLIPELYVGIGFQNLIFVLDNTIALSGCTQLNCAPEDPGFDAPSQTKVQSFFNPSANGGILYVHRYFRVGASLQGPYSVSLTGKVKTKLPSDPQFDGAMVVGDQIDVSLNLPWIVRLGFEARPTRYLRVELAGVYEAWQSQDKIRFQPRGVYIDHVVGIGRYDLRPMELDRQMQGVFGLRLGGEYDVLGRRLTVRAGYLYETSSMPDQTLTVLTPDGEKHGLSLGVAALVGKLRFDVGYQHLFQLDRTVGNSRSLQLNPIQPSINVAVGNGTYRVATDVLSVGLSARF